MVLLLDSLDLDGDNNINILLLHMVIIDFALAFIMDYRISRKNWIIQDWMYLARPKNNLEEMLTMAVFTFLIIEVQKKCILWNKQTIPS